ncbi:sulfatase-like hydrolase/transferase [Hymenobacter sp. J193]|uniref:sulfatase-like hydrolase/transferase n=1 Tax=Hymenobacter sp. J193 TaxID=2898429 RepID=UPI0021513E8F|nr:sulfatase-like hydrolase/transferase [Hymenobacter sp. J193]MCR5886598.1 sulfatase-like hydrolase/transferase [Hymenobacter sp. J193]
MPSSPLVRLRRYLGSAWGLWLLLGGYVALVEMRPGRLYYILTYLLFQESVTQLLGYLLCLGLAVAGLLALWLNRARLLYSLGSALWLVCLAVSLTYRLIIGYNFMYSDAVLAWNNRALAGVALQSYAGQLAGAVLGASLVLAGLHWLRQRIAWRAAPVSALLLPLAGAAIYAQIKWTTGTVDDFPALYRVPLTLLAAITDQLPQPQRAPVPVAPVAPGVPHLFLVVDESITASELTLQDSALRTTPFLYSVRGQLHDFGVASATINQSAGSNIALMSGTRPAELPDTRYRTFARTSIFQFAKRAGYATYYIDAQLGGDVLQNFMSPEDLRYIDHVERPAAQQPQLAYYERDMVVAARLRELARQPRKVFTYVVKAGAHWPYARTYPADSAFFRPVLSPRSLYKDQNRTLNTYHNAVRWTVDEFWRKLMTDIVPRDSAVVVYTSDHGQNLTTSGVAVSHASVYETSPQEVAVPLWVWDAGKQVTFPPTAVTGPGRSHFDIFPTLLRLQGYAPAWVAQHYGSSLLDAPTQEPRRFMTGDLFGRGPHALQPFQWPLAQSVK